MNLHRNIAICTQCVILLANGLIEDDSDGGTARMARIVATWGALAGHIIPSYTGDGLFSNAGCDACGSPLGNDLHPATVLCEHPECAGNKPTVRTFNLTLAGACHQNSVCEQDAVAWLNEARKGETRAACDAWDRTPVHVCEGCADAIGTDRDGAGWICDLCY